MSPTLSALLLIVAIAGPCFAQDNQPRPSAPRQQLQNPLGPRTKIFSWFPMSMKRGHPGAHFKHLLTRYDENEPSAPRQARTNSEHGAQPQPTIIPSDLLGLGVVNGR